LLKASGIWAVVVVEGGKLTLCSSISIHLSATYLIEDQSYFYTYADASKPFLSFVQVSRASFPESRKARRPALLSRGFTAATSGSARASANWMVIELGCTFGPEDAQGQMIHVYSLKVERGV